MGGPFDSVPGIPSVRGAEHPLVVLSEDAIRIVGMLSRRVNAIADFPGVFIFDRYRNAFVFRVQGLAAVVRPEYADGGDSAPQAVAVLRIDKHRVRAKSAGSGVPVAPGGVIVQPGYRSIPGVAAIRAAKQPSL